MMEHPQPSVGESFKDAQHFAWSNFPISHRTTALLKQAIRPVWLRNDFPTEHPIKAPFPQPHASTLLIPRTCTPLDTKKQFAMANRPNLHTFELWEETGAPEGNLHAHGENVQTPHCPKRSFSWYCFRFPPSGNNLSASTLSIPFRMEQVFIRSPLIPLNSR